MRLAASVALLTFGLLATAQASATGVATPKPSIIDQIKHPPLNGEKHAGMCQTQCHWVGRQKICNTYRF
jgi:hypothetical protein